MIKKGNILTPATRGAVCDIYVGGGGANLIAQLIRPVASESQAKLEDRSSDCCRPICFDLRHRHGRPQ